MSKRFRKLCASLLLIASGCVVLPALADRTVPVEAAGAARDAAHQPPGPPRADTGTATGAGMPVLSQDEREQLAKLPTLRIGYEADAAPFSFLDTQGRFDGLAADYLDHVVRTLGLNVRFIPARDFLELQRLAQNKEIDAVAASMRGDLPDEDIRFSMSYERIPEVIVTRTDGPDIDGPGDLAGRRVSVRDDPGVLAAVKSAMRDSTLLPAASDEAGLADVASGKADAYIGTLPEVDALLRARYIDVLHVAGPAGIDREFAIGVDKQYAGLIPLINRVLQHMSVDDRLRIRSRWIADDYMYGVPLAWVFGVSAGTLAIAFALGFAYHRTRREVLARRRAEVRLADQLQFQEALLETIPYPIFAKDAAGRYLLVNAAYEQRHGVKHEDLVGTSGTEGGFLADSAHAAAIAAAIEDTALNADHPVPFELHSTDEEHNSRHELLWVRRLGHASEGKAGIVGSTVDVTPIRAAEERARESERRLSSITKTLPVAVFEVSIYHDGSRRFTYAAGDTLGTIGLTPEALIADSGQVASMILPEDLAVVERHIERAVRELVPIPKVDMRVLTGHGTRWIRTAGGQPRTHETGVEWSGYWVDVSDAHEQAEALRASMLRSQREVEARSAFLAMMSHEIRTPMAGIVSWLELIGKAGLLPAQSEMLAQVTESSAALQQILDDILDFSRIDSGKLKIRDDVVDLRDVVGGTVGTFIARADAKGLRMHCVLDHRVAYQHRGDGHRIRQILSNLLSNAIKFTEHGSIEIRMALSSASAQRQQVRLSVTDTGVGMDPAKMADLFQPFTQIVPGGSEVQVGSGLGLSISRKLAELMGGDVRLESIEGQGTVAALELELGVVAAAFPDGRLAGKRVSVLVSDPAAELELQPALRFLGFEVSLPGSGARGQLHDGRADLVITDALNLNFGDTPVLHVVQGINPIDKPGEAWLRVSPLNWRSTPHACATALGASPQPPAEPDLGHDSEDIARLLVVEDHQINRRLIESQVQHLGYGCMTASNGQEALAMLARQHFDLILTDCHMPVMDGFVLTARIRGGAVPGQENIPIIATSAGVLADQVERCREAGMNDFLSKPILVATLKATVERHLPPHAGLARAVATEQAEDPIAGHPGSPAQAQALIRDLVEATEQDLVQLDAAIARGDSELERELTHKMRGALLLFRSQAVGAAETPLAGRDDLALQLARLREWLARSERAADS